MINHPKDAEQIKERIINFVNGNGPSLPVQIAKRIQLDGIFTSAFLSELLSEKKLKMTFMRVGTSPVYFLEGQESQLEKFGEQYLKSKEKDVFFILKEKKFLKDSESEPAIRVALRSIKDFAVQFTKNSETYWRYYLANENEFYIPIEELKKQKQEEKMIGVSAQTEKIASPEYIVEEKQTEPIKKKKQTREKITKQKSMKKSAVKKQDNKFLERVKEFLFKNAVEILNIEGLGKEELLLRIKIKGEEQLLVAYNKKKISEKEIIKAAKKASEFNLKYSILLLGELPRKISELIEALHGIKEIEKIS